MLIPRDYNRLSGSLRCQPAHNNNRLSGNLRHTSHPHLQGHVNNNDASSSIICNPMTRVVDYVASCQPALVVVVHLDCYAPPQPPCSPPPPPNKLSPLVSPPAVVVTNLFDFCVMVVFRALSLPYQTLPYY